MKRHHHQLLALLLALLPALLLALLLVLWTPLGGLCCKSCTRCGRSWRTFVQHSAL